MVLMMFYMWRIFLYFVFILVVSASESGFSPTGVSSSQVPSYQPSALRNSLDLSQQKSQDGIPSSERINRHSDLVLDVLSNETFREKRAMELSKPSISHCEHVKVKGSGYYSGSITLHVAVFAPYMHRFIFTIERVLPAVHVAEDYIKELNLLPNFHFNWLPGNSKCNSRDAAMHAFHAVTRYKVAMFLGPVCDYSLAPVARYAPYWNIPIIGPGGFAHNFGQKLHGSEGAEYPLLTRMGTTFNSMALTFIDFFKHFRWGKVRILYDSHTRNEIVPRFCHLAGGALGFYLKNDRRLKFDLYQLIEYSNESLRRTLEDELGTESAGKLI
ncbi:hypothetical protein ACOMHN_038687 [Nucella lapillus]